MNTTTIDERIQMVRDDMTGRVPEARQAREQHLAELLKEKRQAAERVVEGVLAHMEGYAARMSRADALAAKYTACDTLAELCVLGVENGYRPTLSCLTRGNKRRRAELKELADAYDEFQETLGDPRRAFRI